MFNTKLLLVLAFCSSTLGAILRNGVVIPTYSTVCTRNDSKLNDCLKGSLSEVIKKISKDGIRQLNLPPLDPWYVSDMTVNFGEGQPYKVSMSVKDTNTYGFSRLQFKEVRAQLNDPEKISIEIDFFNKKVYVDGGYEAKGIVSDYPILSSGRFNVSMTDVSGTFKLKGHLVERDSQKYLMVERATMRPEVGNASVGMTNENSKYPEITTLFVGLMNQFWRAVYQEILPFIEEGIDKTMTPMINLVTLKIPFDQLIPPN